MATGPAVGERRLGAAEKHTLLKGLPASSERRSSARHWPHFRFRAQRTTDELTLTTTGSLNNTRTTAALCIVTVGGASG